MTVTSFLSWSFPAEKFLPPSGRREFARPRGHGRHLQSAQPLLECEGAEKRQDPHIAPLFGAIHAKGQRGGVYDAGGFAFQGRVPKDLPLGGEHLDQPAADIRLSFAFENFGRNDSGEGASHERPSLIRADELLARDAGTKRYEVTVEQRVTPFVAALGGNRGAGNLAGESFHGGCVGLQARERAEEAEPDGRNTQAVEVAGPETGCKPSPVAFGQRASSGAGRQKGGAGAAPHPGDGFAFRECPIKRTAKEC